MTAVPRFKPSASLSASLKKKLVVGPEPAAPHLEPLVLAKSRTARWLAAHGLEPASSEAETRARARRGEERDVMASASSEASRLMHLGIDASDVFTDARDELLADGVCAEHVDLPVDELLPLLYELACARSVGLSAAARRRVPAPASFGAAHRWPSCPTRTAPAPEVPLALVLVARDAEDVAWLETLPERVTFHVYQRRALQPDLPAAQQTLLPGAGGAAHSYLSFLAAAAEQERDARMRKAAAASGWQARSHTLVQLDDAHDPRSIQRRIITALRKKGGRVMDMFKKWDADRSGHVDKREFSAALAALRIEGEAADYAELFDAWDESRNGLIEYTELIEALHAGRRHDTFVAAAAPPHWHPLPPLVVLSPGDPFEHNSAFVDDLALLVAAAEVGRAVPRFTPLGLGRGGERFVTCDLSGGPAMGAARHSPAGDGRRPKLLPLAPLWRSLLGPDRPPPLWLRYTPGGVFALSRDAALLPGAEPPGGACKERAADGALEEGGGEEGEEEGGLLRAAALYAGAASRLAAAPESGGPALERLWAYLFSVAHE